MNNTKNTKKLAIINYNSHLRLLEILKETEALAKQLDEVFILDDCSTDDSINIAKRNFPHLTYVIGNKNKGAGGNRNRVLPYLNGSEIIFFVDVDIEIESENIASALDEVFKDKNIGMAGFFIEYKTGGPMGWNYGHQSNPEKDAKFFDLLKQYEKGNKEQAIAALKKENMDYNWINGGTLFPLEKRRVDWVAEGLFAIRADLFKELNGYDENLRYHEGQDLSNRVRNAGYDVVFSPKIKGKHLELQVRENREEDKLAAEEYLAKKWLS